MLHLGIDDSGRGPVIGPMIIAGCLLDEKDEAELKKLGVKDSKQVTPAKRDILAKEIRKKAVAYEVITIHPKEIDARSGIGLNLNHLEAVKMAEVINKLNNGKKIKVFVDCPSPNIPAWKGFLMRHIEKKENLEIHAEHKADVNHVSCSAASILAKEKREQEVEKIKKLVGADFGSGYSHDPVTIKFLKDYYHKHKKDGIFRETWGTVGNHKKEKEQKKLLEF